MMEELMKFSLPTECWVEFFSNLNPIAMKNFEWELEDYEDSQGNTALQNILDGYSGYMSRKQLLESAKYKDMLSLCYRINIQDIVYEPGKEEYWRQVHRFLVQLFKDIPALNVEKAALLKEDERKQVFREEKTNDDLIALVNRFESEAEGADDLVAFRKYLTNNPNLFGVGQKISSEQTDYTIVFKRRAVLRSCIDAIEYLLRKYESGETPKNWRHL